MSRSSDIDLDLKDACRWLPKRLMLVVLAGGFAYSHEAACKGRCSFLLCVVMCSLPPCT